MKRITKLTLKNFKAFRNADFKFNGRHALVYGNNGSGKSSIYWALYTLFESSHKDLSQARKYFDNPETEKQSLRNVDSQLTDESSIRIEWQDSDSTKVGEQAGHCLVSGLTNEAASKPQIAEGSLGSDFISYRLFQHFNGSNRHDVNLWPAFVRDILPYYLSDEKQQKSGPGQGTSLPYTAAIEAFADRLAADDKQISAYRNRKATNAKVAAAFAADWAKFNDKLNVFIEKVADKANEYLAFQAERSDLDTKLEIKLEFKQEDRLDQASLRILAGQPADERTSFLRQYQIAKIKLTVFSKRPTEIWHPSERPQTFLNEARLTRIAMAIRLGALLTRTPTNFNILCFDDVLVSLDMANRLDVLEWLFNQEVPLLDGSYAPLLKRYQLIFLTHDQTLFTAVKHYADNRSDNLAGALNSNNDRNNWAKWNFFKLYQDENSGTAEPHIQSTSGEHNDYIQQAENALGRFDYGACANYLRKFVEQQLEGFLPIWRQLDGPSPKGELKIKDLSGLIDQLVAMLDEYGQPKSPFDDLQLYRQLHLNPLSHHHPQPIVLPNELRKFIKDVVPALKNLKSVGEPKIAYSDEKPTYIAIDIVDANTNAKRTFKIRLREPLEKLTFGNNQVMRSNSLCELEGEIIAGGVLIDAALPNPQPRYKLRSLFDELQTFVGYTTLNTLALDSARLQKAK